MPHEYLTLADAPSWPVFLADRPNSGYEAIPEWVGHELWCYARFGRHPLAHSLRGVLANNLALVMGADDETLAALRPIWHLVYNELPGNSWKTTDNIAAWIARGGRAGQGVAP